LLRTLMADRDQGGDRLESRLEARLLRAVHRAGLPPPRPQVRVRAGTTVARLDFGYPEQRVGIETHGYRWHGGRERWERDLRRVNALTLAGWTVLTFSWNDVAQHPETVVAQIASALEASGASRASSDRASLT
ncbi:MAG: endonuclease domain-containing protein, partial [Actinomycetota bacterium]|nr:endonuclease domain-containing protein [Actinomycetota bacterium]